MKQKFISIQEALKRGKGKVSLRGWVYRIRKGKDKIFVILRDATDIIQCVFSKEKFRKQWNDIDKLLLESSMELHGTIKPDKRAVTNFEVQVSDFEVLSYAEDFPIGKEQTQEFLLDKRHLWIRSRRMQAILKIRS